MDKQKILDEMNAKKRRKKRLIIIVVVALLVIISASALNIIFRYFKYDEYKKYEVKSKTEKGERFVAVNEDKPDVEGMVLVSENDNLKLYTNLETTEIAVYNKNDGSITYSNPQDRDTHTGTGINASNLSSTLAVTYYNKAGNVATINNYDMSIKNGQFETESIKDGIRYIYTLADEDSIASIVPYYISEDGLNKVMEKSSDYDARTVKGKYKLENGTYVLNDSAKKSKVGMEKLNKIFEKAGYTEEDYAKDMEGHEEDESLSITIPLEYRLTDKGLEATVKAADIEEHGNVYISQIDVLQFFGAASNKAQGYILVPDGSGALINLNSGNQATAYNQAIYDIDPVAQNYVVIEETECARLPIFGIKADDNAIFARITAGDAIASVNADVAGKLNNYNYAYASFNVREKELLNMFGVQGSKSDIPVVEKSLYKIDLSVSYSFLTKDDASYSGMARTYRKQLIDEGILKETNQSESVPLYLDIIGGVEQKKHIMGIPYEGVCAMTTYDEASEIVDNLYDSDITNLRLNYQGWFNGGIYHDVADKIKLIGSVGSKSDLESLNKKLEDKGGKLFMDVAFQKVSHESKRFTSVLEASKYYSGYVVELGATDPSTVRQTSNLEWYDEMIYYMISPKFLNRYVNKFASKITKYDVSGINLTDLGSVLTSDKKRSELINRQQAENIVIGQYEKLAETKKNLMETGGNEYSLKYVSDIIDAPTSYSAYYIIDEQVPFYEMVIHGSISYSGEAFNLMDDDLDDDFVLNCIEYGIAPRFTLSYKDPSKMKYTSSADKYSVLYTTWLDKAKEMYGNINEALKDVDGSAMINHEKLDNGLIKVDYENGKTIYINKTSQDITVDGNTVKAKNYLKTGGTVNE
jgi:hypothetical protein